MPQYLKQDVQRRIEKAALQVFADKGFAAATVAEIARCAQISTGNVYRYFGSKDDLLLVVIPQTLVAELQRLLRARFISLHGVGDIRQLPTDAPYLLIAAELLAFCIEHRQQVVLLLSRAEGSVYADFAAATVRMLCNQALEYLSSLHPTHVPSKALRSTLHQVYRGFVQTLTEILDTTTDAKVISKRVHFFSQYHLAGMRELFAFEVRSTA